MLIDDVYQDSVGFLFGEPIGKGGMMKPIATAFYIRIKNTEGFADYAVTAAHCVERRFAQKERLFIEVDECGYVQTPHAEWVTHPSTDVAVFPIRVEHKLRPLPAEVLLDKEDLLHTGHELFLMGLFQPDTREAIARFGKLSKPRTNCRISFGGSIVQSPCHLAETISWQGQSGSPVFLNDASICTDRNDEFYGAPPKNFGYGIPPPVYLTRHIRPPIVGLLHGPFSISGGFGEEDNSGVSAVIPARYIRETLEMGYPSKPGGSVGHGGGRCQ